MTPGVGKTVLLDYLAGQASGSGCRVGRAVGVQSEMELAFAGLHQLCAPMLSGAEQLPVPQRDTLRTALGVAAGPPPDRFLVGLAVLSLLSEAAGDRPLICLVDDVQWLDLPGAAPLTGRIEDSFARQLEAMPEQTRRLVLMAAADPSGDRALVLRAAGRLGLPVQAETPAVEAGLVEFGAWVRFRHPLARRSRLER